MPSADELVARGWERRREGRLDDARRAIEQAVRIARETAPGTALVKALGALAHVAPRALGVIARRRGEATCTAHPDRI